MLKFRTLTLLASLPLFLSLPALAQSQAYAPELGMHPLVNHADIDVCVKTEPGAKVSACTRLANDALAWQDKPGQSLSEVMVGYQYEYSARFSLTKFYFDGNDIAMACQYIYQAQAPFEKARIYAGRTDLNKLGQVAQTLFEKQKDLQPKMISLCKEMGH